MKPRIAARKPRRAVLAAALALAVLLVVPAGTAFAAVAAPGWALDPVARPTVFAPEDSSGEDLYAVTATNVGSAPTGGSIAIALDLPPGVSAQSVHFYRTTPKELAQTLPSGLCTTAPVSCVYPGSEPPIGPGDTLGMEVHVATPSLSGPVQSTATISGGGAAGATAVAHNEIGTEPAPFGPSDFAMALGGADGAAASSAGSHPYQITTTLDFNTIAEPAAEFHYVAGENVRDVAVKLPPGLIGDPTATPRCSPPSLEHGNCPPASQVGLVNLYTDGLDDKSFQALYNITPRPGVAAEFGFQVFGVIGYLDATLRSGGDYGVTITSALAPAGTGIIGIHTIFWGVPADPSHDPWRRCAKHLYGGGEPEPPFGCPAGGGFHSKPLLTLPTSCTGPLKTTLSADSWQHPGAWKPAETETLDGSGNPVGIEACNQPPFDPTIAVVPETSASDSPSGLRVDLHLPQNDNPEGVAEADLKDATVTLPAGVTLNPSSANGLEGCSSAQVELHGPAPARCPGASKIGSVEVHTPLLDHPLKGAVYVATPGDNPFGSLLAIYIAVADPETGVVLKLAGHVQADPRTGQLTTTFDENPQLPFEDFELDFFGGPGAALMTPQTCGTFTTTSDMTPWTAPHHGDATPSWPFEVTSGPGGSACVSSEAQEPNQPAFEAGTKTPFAGAYSPFVLRLSRQDGSQRLSTIGVTLPPGLSGKLAGIPRCLDADLAAAARKTGAAEREAPSCPAASQLGTANVSVGAGPDPFWVPGKAYLAGPYEGAPFSIAIVTPAVAGPYDLGTVVVRAGLFIDSHTAQVTVKSDPIPSILQGIPLDVRSIDVDVDRSRFMLNPTSCEAMKATGAIAGAQGMTASVSNRFQVGGCGELAFKPGFEASTQAKHSRKDGASLHVVVRSGPGQANIAYVHVSLPSILPSRLETLKQACFETTFASNPAACPIGSRIGGATAYTPLLAKPLTGPVYFVSHGGAAFPDLVAVLQGEGVTIDLVGNTQIRKDVTSSTFASVPDVPVTRFDMVLPTGAHSALTAIGDLCRQRAKLTMPTVIRGQNGALVERRTKIAVSGCGGAKQGRRR